MQSVAGKNGPLATRAACADEIPGTWSKLSRRITITGRLLLKLRAASEAQHAGSGIASAASLGVCSAAMTWMDTFERVTKIQSIATAGRAALIAETRGGSTLKCCRAHKAGRTQTRWELFGNSEGMN